MGDNISKKLDEIMDNVKFIAKFKTLNRVDYGIYKAKVELLDLDHEKVEDALKKLVEVMGL